METLVTSEEIIETIMGMGLHERMCFDKSVETCLGLTACLKSILETSKDPITMLMLTILMGISIGRVLERKRLEVGFLEKLVKD